MLRDLDHASAVYAGLRDPQDPAWNREEKQAIAQLLMFNVRQPLAMLMACHAAFFEQDRAGLPNRQKRLRGGFRYNVICNLQAHEQERLYNEMAQKITGGTYIRPADVISALNPVYPDDNQFKAAFAEKELRTTNNRNKKVVRYILFEIERQQSGQEFDFESATYNLEHILPEHPSQAWDHIEENRQDRLIYRLGNMTPLEAGKTGMPATGSMRQNDPYISTAPFKSPGPWLNITTPGTNTKLKPDRNSWHRLPQAYGNRSRKIEIWK